MPGPETGPGPEVGAEKEPSEADKLYQAEVERSKEYNILDLITVNNAESVCKKYRSTPEKEAKNWAKSGCPKPTVIYLELSELPHAEKKQILALAYEGVANFLEARAQEEENLSQRDIYEQRAKIRRKAARILRGETETQK